MNIQDYYNNYKDNKKYPLSLPNTVQDKTIKDFYTNMISKHLLPIQNVLAWHKMLVEYAKRPDAILWIRRYESGNKVNGKWNTRRACVVKHNNLTIVYVSNYDAHEIFNMIRLGVAPDINEFARLMNEHHFPLHYKSGNSCEEISIKSYPMIGNVYGGILTTNHLYLAHINDVNGKYLHPNGNYSKLSDKEIEHLFPRGIPSNWQIGPDGYIVYETKRTLSENEKSMVIAHFLRFVDPLNYYVTPSDNYHINNTGSRISNDKDMNNYVEQQYSDLYGQDIMNEFKSLALVASNSSSFLDKDIDISYGNVKLKNEKKNKTSFGPRNRKTTLQDVPVILIPENIDVFKQELLNKKHAEITLTYDTGRIEKKPWVVSHFDPTSNLMGNIKSRPFWRTRKADGLIEVRIKVK